jgi:hypothetical protein
MHRPCRELFVLILVWNLTGNALLARSAQADGPAVERATLADPERHFWACDYAASSRLVDAGEAATCRNAYEALMRSKFGDDFAEFMRWWQQNKVAKHAALRATETRSTGR